MSVKDPRLSQILPVIRCSDCGHDVEFRLLGEHVCSSAPPMPALPAIPVAKRQAGFEEQEYTHTYTRDKRLEKADGDDEDEDDKERTGMEGTGATKKGKNEA
ncbi:hypothetical protein BGZ50_005584 [Haplosporangium sp. Z 11]|nr:hypothetical protein BGZ50_005584 [Haplosporangium sp. Z 11]